MTFTFEIWPVRTRHRRYHQLLIRVAASGWWGERCRQCLSTGSTEDDFGFWFFDFCFFFRFVFSIVRFAFFRFSIFGSSFQQQARVSTAVFIVKASAAVFVEISSMDDAGNEKLLRLLLLHRLQKERRERSRRCCWARPILLCRDQVGEYHTLVQEMLNADPVVHTSDTSV